MTVQYSESNFTKSSHSVITAKCSATNNLGTTVTSFISPYNSGISCSIKYFSEGSWYLAGVTEATFDKSGCISTVIKGKLNF